ncbi:spore coat U domain-containing protein [Amylibacter sp.]|nr:spore coat U domain-containing protein [Amylibacter sp.]
MKIKFNQNKIKLAIVSTILAGSVGLSGASQAETLAGTGNLAVSADVDISCSAISGTLDFSDYDTTSEDDHEGAGTITSNCTMGAGVQVRLNHGQYADENTPTSDPVRKMLGANGDHLTYKLYSDSGRSVVWGNDDTNDVAEVGEGIAATINIYGKMAAQQPATGGAYSDTVGITIVY